jgi:hypothetical protein
MEISKKPNINGMCVSARIRVLSVSILTQNLKAGSRLVPFSKALVRARKLAHGLLKQELIIRCLRAAASQ